MKAGPSREAALDGLRGCAILMVLCDHFGINHPGTFPWGVVGVRLFLLLSGYYLMHRIYSMHPECEANPDRRISLSHFYGTRLSRLVPVCYAALLVSALTGMGFDSSEWLWHALFATNFLAIAKGTWPESFCHFWSISVQIQFYLLLPLLFLRLPRKAFGIVLVLGFCFAPFYRALCLGADASPMLRWFFLPACLDAFAAGAFIIYLEQERQDLLLRLQKYLLTGFSLSLLAMGLAYAMRMSCSNRVTMAAMESCECLFLFFTLLWIRTRRESFATRMLRFRPLAWIGMISYSIYAFHPWVHVFFLLHIAPHLSPLGLTENMQLIPLFLLVFAVALGSWKLFEQPGLASFWSRSFDHLPEILPKSVRHLNDRPVFRFAFQGAAALALFGTLIAVWPLAKPTPSAPLALSDIRQEIQELQLEIQTADPEETPIISQDPTEWEPMSGELQEFQEEDFQLTL